MHITPAASFILLSSKLDLTRCINSFDKKKRLMNAAPRRSNHLNPLTGIMYKKVAGMNEAKLYPYIEITLNVSLLMCSVPLNLMRILRKAGIQMK
jgi:hypothetical protein